MDRNRRPSLPGAGLALIVAAGLLAPAAARAQTASAPPASAPAAPAGPGQTPQEGQSQAQPPAQPGQEPVPAVQIELIVTAPRMDVPLKSNPAATTVVTPRTLDSIPRGIGAEEALRMVPGVKVDNQADGERVHVSIRGQGLLTERGIRGIKVLLDGLPLNDPTGFAPDLFDVDWDAVQRIEVLRGSASALYGGGSSGGVINITTRDGSSGKPTAQARLDGGSYSFLKGFGEVGGTSGPVNYRVSASGNTGDGYRVHTNFHATNLYGKFKIKVGERTNLTAITAGTLFYNGNAEGLNLTWLAQDRRMANPDALTYDEYQRTRRITTGVSGTTTLDNGQELGYAIYYRNTAWRESVPSSIDHRAYNTPGLMVHYRIDRGAGGVKNHLTVGSDVDWQKIDEHRLPNLGYAEEGTDLQSNQIIRQRGVGVYVLDQVDLGPQWGVMMGLRTDRIHNELEDLLELDGVDLSGRADFSKTTGRVGVAYNPWRDLGVYASWGQGFLPPATEELANNPDALGGFNTHLVPATSHGEEFGVRGAAPHGVSYDVGFFRLDTKNDFGRYRVPSRPLETFYGNLGSSRRYGLETSVGYYPAPRLAVQLAYTFNDFKYTNIVSLFGSFTDKVMPNAPRHQVGFDATYDVNGRWIVGLNLFGQTMQYVDQANDLTADGYLLINPRVVYRFIAGGHPGEVQLSATNVGGVKYIAFTEPDPDGNSFQPGPTRQVFLGVRLWVGR